MPFYWEPNIITTTRTVSLPKKDQLAMSILHYLKCKIYWQFWSPQFTEDVALLELHAEVEL